MTIVLQVGLGSSWRGVSNSEEPNGRLAGEAVHSSRRQDDVSQTAIVVVLQREVPVTRQGDLR